MSMIKKCAAGIAGTALTVAGAYVLSVRGRVGQPGLEKFRGWKYAHRGLHDEKFPENSMAAFRAAVENGYGAELDVHLLADGGLAVIHDSKLIRTTGQEGRVEDLTTEQLSQYHLQGTEETIPNFLDVLKVFEGKTPLIVEIKVENNVDALCETVAKVLDGYKGDYCVESFDPRVVYWFKKNRPHVIRGQLTENYFRSENVKLHPVLKFCLTHQIFNCATAPDFVAYSCRDYKTVSNTIARKIWKMEGVTWTLRSADAYTEAVEEGWIPIFEKFRP